MLLVLLTLLVGQQIYDEDISGLTCDDSGGECEVHQQFFPPDPPEDDPEPEEPTPA